MKTFNEWLADEHPEALDEANLLRNLAAGAAFALGAAGVANHAQAAPPPAIAAAAQSSEVVTAEAEYDFDDAEDVRDAIEEATLKAKADMAKKYGQKTLSGIMKPQVKIDKKNRKVLVTIAVPQGVKSAAGPPAKTNSGSSASGPSTTIRRSRTEF